MIATKIAQNILKENLPKDICLNVNVPKGDVNGIQIASQTKGKWTNEFFASKDAMQNDIFWMSGRFDNWEKENKNSDEWALSNGYASVVPVKVDMTHYEIIDQLKHWEQEVFTK